MLTRLLGRAERQRLTLVEPEVPYMSRPGEFRAVDLAALLGKEVYDAEDAARFLGIARNSIEYAAYRKRIPYVQYGAKKLFTRADLMDYATNRGRGRESALEDAPVFVVK
jgi:hypothetical protein